MMFALLLRTEWYKFLHSPGWPSSWNWRMFIFDNYNGVQFIPNINFFFSLNHLFVKCNFWEVFWSHGVSFFMLMKYNGFLMMFTKVMGIYECSLPWCHFWSSVRDLLIWKIKSESFPSYECDFCSCCNCKRRCFWMNFLTV